MVTHAAMAEIVGVELLAVPAGDFEQRERILRIAFGIVEVDTYQELARTERKRKRLRDRAAMAEQVEPF